MRTSPMSRPNQPIPLAEMQVEFTIDGRLVSAPGRIIQRLWPYPCVVIEVSNVARDPQPLSQDATGSSFPVMSEGPSVVQLESGTWVEVVPESWLFNQREAELHLQKSPIVVLRPRQTHRSSGIPCIECHRGFVRLAFDSTSCVMGRENRPSSESRVVAERSEDRWGICCHAHWGDTVHIWKGGFRRRSPTRPQGIGSVPLIRLRVAVCDNPRSRV